MSRFSKADIKFHSDGFGREAHAAVNVKVYDWREPDLRAVALDCGASESEATDFAAWYSELPEAERSGWADLALEFGWDHLTGEAREIFGRSAKVYSEGRSGGWAVVTPGCDRYTPADHARAHSAFTRSEVETWNALAVSKWGRFVKACREAVADLPYQAASLAYLNSFEPAREARETARRYSFFYDVPGETVSGGAA